MSLTETGRHNLPLLAVSQAQKEITHNEALVRIDALLHPVVEEELAVPPSPTERDIGKCWLIAPSPIGAWQGMTGRIAIWTGGSWRYCIPTEGLKVRVTSSGSDRVRSNAIWVDSPTIPDPANGTVIDVEARSAIVALLGHLRAIGHVTS
ncbi:MAG TPA: DUF2793 domain-containing protein [Sphingorhabdus sp.]|jgi:hypothetical protein|nr:DUF2793 domain-containing protein [Sphingorhabdus sp.]